MAVDKDRPKDHDRAEHMERCLGPLGALDHGDDIAAVLAQVAPSVVRKSVLRISIDISPSKRSQFQTISRISIPVGKSSRLMLTE
jgi:hypothetical protein